MSKFQVGDKVIFEAEHFDKQFSGSTGVIIGPFHSSGRSLLYEVDWQTGPGVLYQKSVKRFCRHFPASLHLSSSPIQEPNEDIYKDLI